MSKVLNIFKKEKKEDGHKVATYVGICVIGLILVSIAASLAFSQYYSDKIFPGVSISGIDVSAQTRKQARQTLLDATSQWKDGLNFIVIDEQGNEIDRVIIPQNIVNEEAGLLYDIYAYDINAMIDSAYSVGRTVNVFSNIVNQVKGLITHNDLEVVYSFSDKQLEDLLTKRFEFNGVIRQPVDADIQVAMYSDTRFGLTKKESEGGYSVNFDETMAQIHMALRENTYSSFEMKQEEIPALITTDLINPLEEQITKIISRGNIVLQNGDISWEVGPTIYGKWLSVIYDNGSVTLGFRDDDVKNYLEKYIQPALTKDPINARFQIKDGKVTAFKASRPGSVLLVEETIESVNETFFDNQERLINLVIEETQPEITTENANDLGIKEIIGIGKSNMAGSPANRRHNIAIGAAAVNGTVLAPGEEFSLLKVLGNIDASNGYKQELVIKGNKTIPEYGGGLCQIGTTTFRGALDAGLKITERRNHSYRVSYYEPAGTDATIYDPAPDFKFLNDTPNHVLILTRIEGNELIWEYWGTDDGRVSVVEKPKIFNIIKPPPTKLIETDELAPGEKKCTERAHNGATATLTRKVTYVDGTENEQTWTSVYRPWQEVCLIGKQSGGSSENDGEQTANEALTDQENELLAEDGVHIPQEPAQ